MKKFLLILIAAISASFMNAETTDSYKYIYEPGTIHIYEHQKRWNTIDGKFGGSATYLYSITMVVDVQPKGKGHDITLARLISYFYDDVVRLKHFYEEDGVLYEYYTEPKSSSAKLVPWIDMRAHKGDKLYWYDYGKQQKKYYYSVTDEQTVQVRGIDRRILGINAGSGTYYWIEGIGASKKDEILSFESDAVIPTSVYSSPAYLAKCYNGDNCIFGQDDVAIHTAIEDVCIEDSDSIDTPIYDLMGRQVTNPQSGHLYIQNGKKIIW